MQSVTDDDRRVLTAPAPTVDFGCDILDEHNNMVGDLTPDLVGGNVRHMCYADVHRTCEMQIMRELDWDNVWLRPWQSVTDDGHTARFNLGVFRPAIPELPMGDLPLTYDVTGADRLSLLQDSIGDTARSAAGMSVTGEIRRAIDDSDVPGAVIVDPSLDGATLDRDMVWVLALDGSTSFLRRVNDLGKSIAARGVWMNSDGDYRIQKYVKVIDRTAEWLFDLTDTNSNIVEVDRTSTIDGWSRVNWWRFIRTNLDYRPENGAGQYTVDRSSGGRKVRSYQSVSAANQIALVAAGDAIVDTALHTSQTVEIKLGPFPILEHFDTVDYLDPQLGGLKHCQVRSWNTDLATGSTSIVLEVPRG